MKVGGEPKRKTVRRQFDKNENEWGEMVNQKLIDRKQAAR